MNYLGNRCTCIATIAIGTYDLMNSIQGLNALRAAEVDSIRSGRLHARNLSSIHILRFYRHTRCEAHHMAFDVSRQTYWSADARVSLLIARCVSAHFES